MFRPESAEIPTTHLRVCWASRLALRGVVAAGRRQNPQARRPRYHSPAGLPFHDAFLATTDWAAWCGNGAFRLCRGVPCPEGVAQIFNLLYRRIVFGRRQDSPRFSDMPDGCRLQICDTAD